MQCKKFKLHFLLHCADLLEDRLRIHLSPLRIRPRQAQVIDALDRVGSTSQVELAREFDVTPASMSTMTARLISAGFIRREVDPNEHRSNVLRLSESGRALLEDVHGAWREVDRIIENAITPERARELAALTRDLRNALGGRAPGHGREKGRTAPAAPDRRR